MNINSLKTFKEFYGSRKVLVTGGAGFIGSHLVDKLVSLGAQVTVIDNLSKGTLDNITHRQNIQFIHESIEDRLACSQATREQDIIFHLAALTSVPESERDHDRYQATNVHGTFNLLRASVNHKVTSFIFSSSAAVYGNQIGICSENSPVKPLSFYGLTKLVGEIFARYFHQKYEINTLCLRYFNVYGPRQQEGDSVVAQFRHRLQNNIPITIYGDGSQTRDFIHVNDIVYANLSAGMKTKEYSGQTINVASGKSTSILQLFNQLKQELRADHIQPIFEPARKGDIAASHACCKKLLKTLHISETI